MWIGVLPSLAVEERGDICDLYSDGKVRTAALTSGAAQLRASSIENERFGLVFAKTGSINSGTGGVKTKRVKHL